MAKHLQGPEQPEVVEERRRLGSSLAVMGWMLLIFDAIVAAFVLIGLRDGSTLWLWWTLVEGGLGLLLLGIGSHLQTMDQLPAEHREGTTPAKDEVEDSGSKAA
jgi:hypothetical protein